MSKAIGPVTGGRRGRPFGAVLADPETVGYHQEEFLVDGTATRYRSVGPLGADGQWQVEPDGSAPFRTRVLVRRRSTPPGRTARF